jgi:hypothetical protein
MLAEHGHPIQKTHDLTILLNQVLPLDGTLRLLRRGLKGVSRYAVEYRYPGLNTSARQANARIEKRCWYESTSASDSVLRTTRCDRRRKPAGATPRPIPM